MNLKCSKLEILSHYIFLQIKRIIKRMVLEIISKICSAKCHFVFEVQTKRKKSETYPQISVNEKQLDLK